MNTSTQRGSRSCLAKFYNPIGSLAPNSALPKHYTMVSLHNGIVTQWYHMVLHYQTYNGIITQWYQWYHTMVTGLI